MTLIDKITAAISQKDKAALASLKAQAEGEFAPLRASGQVNYIKHVESLLSQLEKLPTVTPIALNNVSLFQK